MTIKNALILGAGLGTRMGEVGKTLPKPLWPVFDHSMLYLQVKFLRELGVENIFVNVFHKSELIINEVNSWSNESLEIVKEEELMGSGGAIHNLLIKNNLDDEKLLTINSDAFYMFGKTDLEKMEKSLLSDNAVLLGREVNDKSYNQLIIKDNQLQDINKKSKPNSFITYSGVGLINTSKIKKTKGPSNFWKTVANYKEDQVAVLIAKEDIEFYDFGTLGAYFKNLNKVLNLKQKGVRNNFLAFLERQNCLEQFNTRDSVLGLKTLVKLKWEGELVKLI